ncbi:MrcB family domain-containing protein [Chitinophaga varians]|uniref:MrcB family domain-containing protein n=1 Tax=Chitinophaga varians TaxID=2202339 RepID=UPI00165FB4C2|nr:DUF3578 domain-containing protein [Chitinophaga varians]MBC9911151.1 DUF3578 domain-containing protein [Chitinophaga varians]
MLTELFSEFINIYPEEKKRNKESANKNYGHLRSTKIMTEQLPVLLQQQSQLSPDQYLFKGSVGKGRMAEVPNLCILDKDITDSPEKGYYVVYLFDPGMMKFFLCLLQGWTQFENTYGARLGRKIILKNQGALRNQFEDETAFSLAELGLEAERTRTRGYIYGTIFHKVYFIDEMPNDQMLLDDLRQMMKVYQTMKAEIGSDIVHKTVPTESDFQEQIQTAPGKQLADGPIDRPSAALHVTTKWKRDVGIASNALQRSQYKCQVDPNHKTFTSQKNKHPFVEAHHFLPMALQGNFENSLDVPENIIVLCPTCHRAFHHGENDYKRELISLFYEDRKLALQRRGITISEKDLLDIYLKKDDIIE